MKVKTGIHGLDHLLGDGIPKNHMVLVSGECGTGKTIFGLQFLFNSSEKGIFLTFEEEPEQLKIIAEAFMWNSKNVSIIKYDPYKFDDIIEVLENNIRENNAKRVVIDSISALGIYIHDVAEIRRLMLQMGAVFKKNECTSLVLSEIANPGSLSRFGVEEFACDGVIKLEKTLVGNRYKRQLSIMKMRSVNHSENVHTYHIARRGIEIL